MKLIGKRIVLRPLKVSDAVRFVKWMNDPEIMKFARGGAKRITLAEERGWIRSIPKFKNQKHFAIDAPSGVHIGGIGFKTMDVLSRNAEIGITIGDKRYWRKGYGTEAMRLLINYGFKRLKLHRIYVHVFSYNVRSIGMNKKLGFKKEGTLHEGVLYKGKFYDELIMGLLRREWLKKRSS